MLPKTFVIYKSQVGPTWRAFCKLQNAFCNLQNGLQNKLAWIDYIELHTPVCTMLNVSFFFDLHVTHICLLAQAEAYICLSVLELCRKWLREFGLGIYRPALPQERCFGFSTPRGRSSIATWRRLQSIIANTIVQLTSSAMLKVVLRGWKHWMASSSGTATLSTFETQSLLARRSYENILKLLHTPVNIAPICCVYTCVLISLICKVKKHS